MLYSFTTRKNSTTYIYIWTSFRQPKVSVSFMISLALQFTICVKIQPLFNIVHIQFMCPTSSTQILAGPSTSNVTISNRGRCDSKHVDSGNLSWVGWLVGSARSIVLKGMVFHICFKLLQYSNNKNKWHTQNCWRMYGTYLAILVFRLMLN